MRNTAHRARGASPAGQVMRAASHGWPVWIRGRTLRIGDHRPASALERRLCSARVSHSIGAPPAPCRATLPSCMPRWTPRRRPPEPLPAQYITPKRTRACSGESGCTHSARGAPQPRPDALRTTRQPRSPATRHAAARAARRAGEQPARGQHGGEPHTRQRGRWRVPGCRRRSTTSPSPASRRTRAAPEALRQRWGAASLEPAGHSHGALCGQAVCGIAPASAARRASRSATPADQVLLVGCGGPGASSAVAGVRAAGPARQHHAHHAALGVWPPTQRPASRGPVLGQRDRDRIRVQERTHLQQVDGGRARGMYLVDAHGPRRRHTRWMPISPPALA
jgi:hypothetical protein